ncbi:MAG TPA: ABC transporter permease [Candidatus Limnocylindrales bacterium]|nr:ABC transporter permease [Candidatus Limnocylindrales bacterium]
MAGNVRGLMRPGGSRAQVAGLDALETPLVHGVSPVRRLWAGLWPKVLAVAIVLLLWQLVVWAAFWPEWTLPGPVDVLARLWADLGTAELWSAVAITMRRGIWGFALAIVIGVVIGAVVSRFQLMRAAIGSLITGLQTMPSIAWFPLAIVLFKLSEEAITFVVVLGAAPSIANGLIHGIDHIPPVLRRAGRVLGATGIDEYRHVIIPAAMPSFVAGLKNGWAFAWRSLMAGEIIVVIANQASLGQLLQVNRELSDAQGLLATMIVILAIGIVLDSLVFGTLERRIRAKRGLLVA